MAITEIYNPLLTNLDNKEHLYVKFLDLVKAFDSVNHTILPKRVEKYEMMECAGDEKSI